VKIWRFWQTAPRRPEMPPKVLVIDPEKCTGCRQCELVCSVGHTGESDPARSRIRVAKREDLGFYLPMTCQNCERAICTEVCPATACAKDPQLLVAVIDPKKCIGCKSCVLACPFSAPSFDEVQRVSIKCDYCGGQPRCVTACTAGAISFVDADKVNWARRKQLADKLIAETINSRANR